MKAAFVAVAAALLVAGCGGSDDAGRQQAGAVEDLASVGTLRAAFAEADGSARVLLLLSPT